MQIILTGATGFIGAEVLAQCLAHPAVTSVLVLSRKPLPTTHPKLTCILQEDFTTYPPDVTERFATADACIWCQGIASPKNQQQGTLVNYDYPLAGARAMKAATKGKPFRFLYLSGKYVERDQNAKLWVLEWARKMRGKTELEVLALGEEGREGFTTYLARPGFVVPAKKAIKHYLFGVLDSTIPVQWLASAMIEVAEKGGKDTWEMDDLVESGKKLEESKSS